MLLSETGEQLEMMGWCASSQILSLTSSVLHQPLGVTLTVCLTPATLISDVLLDASSGSPSQEMGGYGEREMKGIKVFAEFQLHELLLGCPKLLDAITTAPLYSTGRLMVWQCLQLLPLQPLPLSGRKDAGTPDLFWLLWGVTCLPVLRAEPTLCPWPSP